MKFFGLLIALTFGLSSLHQAHGRGRGFNPANGLNFHVNEQVVLENQIVRILNKYRDGYGQTRYSVIFMSGQVVNGYLATQFYKTDGCSYNVQYPLCVGNRVFVNLNGMPATVVGRTIDAQGFKYAIQYDYGGSIDTGYFRHYLSLQ